MIENERQYWITKRAWHGFEANLLEHKLDLVFSEEEKATLDPKMPALIVKAMESERDNLAAQMREWEENHMPRAVPWEAVMKWKDQTEEAHNANEACDGKEPDASDVEGLANQALIMILLYGMEDVPGANHTTERAFSTAKMRPYIEHAIRRHRGHLQACLLEIEALCRQMHQDTYKDEPVTREMLLLWAGQVYGVTMRALPAVPEVAQ